MQCNRPLWLKGQKLFVPCGKCTACKLARSREWSIRMMNEASLYDKNVFVTLTYKDDCLPDDKSIHKDTLYNFMRRFRRSLDGRLFKYYGCGEYGDKTNRPHYHSIMFNVGFEDFELKRYRYGKAVFKHPAWKYGNIHVGNVTFESCRYVAGYVQKAYYGKKAEEEYTKKGLEVPFQIQTPKIGRDYAEKNEDSIKKYLTMFHKGKEIGIPRYYRKRLGLEDEYVELAIENAKNDDTEKGKELRRLKTIFSLSENNVTEDMCPRFNESNIQKEINLDRRLSLRNKKL